jgi:hypothetical protein
MTLFWQPFVSRTKDNKTVLQNYFNFIGSPLFDDFAKSHQILPINIEVRPGIVTEKPVPPVILMDGESIPLSNHYYYQRGHHYALAQRDKSGQLGCDICSPASGVHVHAIFEMFGKKEMLLSGHFPPTDSMLILTAVQNRTDFDLTPA